MAVDDQRRPAKRLGLVLEALPALLRRDVVALAEPVAVEDGDDVGELLVGDEVHRLPDLAFARLAVADQAIDRLVDAVEPRGGAEPRRHRQALAERAGRRVEEGKAQRRVGMAVDRAVDGAQLHQVLRRHRLGVALRIEGDAEIGASGIDDRHRMALRQHQPVGARRARPLRVPAHHPVHQHRRQMRQRQRRGRMAAPRRRGGAQRQLADLDRLGMDDLVQRRHRPSPAAGALRANASERPRLPPGRRRLPAPRRYSREVIDPYQFRDARAH